MRCCFSSFGKIKHIYGKHIFFANAISTCVFMVTGGAIKQKFEIAYGSRKHWNWKTLGHLSVIGLLIGSQQHYLYKYADQKWPGQSFKQMCKKLFFDHSIITNVTLLTFFTGLNALEGIDWKSLLDEFRMKYWISYPVDVCIGLPTQAFNFYFLPPKYRVLFVAVMSTMTAGFFTLIKTDLGDKR